MGLKGILDTNAIVSFLRGEYNIIELINKTDHFGQLNFF